MIRSRVVGEANIEEARIFLGHKLVHVVCGGTHIHKSVVAEDHLTSFLGLDGSLGVEKLSVLVGRKVIIFKLLFHLVVARILEFPEEKSEEDGHVWVVVEGHAGALFYEEEDKAVVFRVLTVDGDAVERAIEVVGVFRTQDTKLLRGDSHHGLNNALASGVRNGRVEERAVAGRPIALEGAVFYRRDQGFHGELSLRWGLRLKTFIINKS